ncbi:ABC transporter permease [Anaerovibrio sp.]|uniref:ABC transporter permease n=1 Tax=Anaerovibrio sp. TaxID=1872532 RepID=UPI003F16C6A3
MCMTGTMQERIRLFWRHLFFMCQKELLTTLKDRRMRAMMIVPALMQGFLFGYAASYNLDNVPYAVVDEARSEASRSLLGHFAGSGCFQLAASPDSPREIGELIDREEIILAVVIPRDFERKLQQGETAEVQVIADGRNSSVAGMAIGYAGRIVSEWNLERMAERAGSGAGYGGVSVESRTWFNPNQITRWIFSPGLIAMIAFVQVLLLAGMSIAREREQGTFDQLLVTPLSPAELLLGKAVPPMLIGLVQSTILFCIARFWFQIPFAGSLLTLYLALILFIFSLIGVGLMISAISESMQQVMVYLMVLMMPMVLLSGLATPIINMPELLQYATYADPLRFAVDAVRRIYLEGAAAGDLLGDFVPMVLISAITLPLSGWLFYNRAV